MRAHSRVRFRLGACVFIAAASLLGLAGQASAATAPSVLGLRPASGLTSGGYTVTVLGDNFSGTPTVTAGTLSATNVAVISATELTATFPAAPAAGTVDVKVANSNGTSAVGAGDAFTYGTSQVTGLTAQVGLTQVGLTWTAPAVTGLTGYSVYRSNGITNTKIGTVDQYTTSYFDSGLHAGSTYTYTVVPSGAGTTSAGLKVKTATAATQTLTSCPSSPLGTGHYVLGANLSGVGCISFAPSTSGVSIDCAGHTIAGSLDLSGVSNFLVTGCTFSSSGPLPLLGTTVANGFIAHNTFVSTQTNNIPTGMWFTDLTGAVITANTFTNTTLASENVANSQVTGNVATVNPASVGESELGSVAALLGSLTDTLVDGNTFAVAASPAEGVLPSNNWEMDDGLITGDDGAASTIGNVFVGNQVSNVFDAALEPVGYAADNQFLNNTATDAGIDVVGDYHGASLVNNTITGNVSSNGGGAVAFQLGNDPAVSGPDYFTYNTIANNVDAGDSNTDFLEVGSGVQVTAVGNTIHGNFFGSPGGFTWDDTFPASGLATDLDNGCAPATFLSTVQSTQECPTIASMSPAAGPLAGGTTVTLHGAGLLADGGTPSVTVGGVAATNVTAVSDNAITFTAPASAGAASDQVVLSTSAISGFVAGGAVAPVNYQYTATGSRSVTSVFPVFANSKGGTTVQVFGSGFTGATAVTFGSSRATSFKVISANEIDAVAPAGTGSVAVKVTTTGGAVSLASAVTYTGAPVVTSIATAAGATYTTASTLIYGQNLAGASAVTLGGTPVAAFKVITPSEIAVSGSPTAANTGADYQVVTPGGTSAKSSADVYTSYASPTVTGIAPSSGPAAGGTTVTLTGTNFVPGLTAAQDDYGTARLPVTVTSPTTLTVTLPSHPDGVVPLFVFTPGGVASTQYTYAN